MPSEGLVFVVNPFTEQLALRTGGLDPDEDVWVIDPWAPEKQLFLFDIGEFTDYEKVWNKMVWWGAHQSGVGFTDRECSDDQDDLV